jgi:hypothetical protein
MLKMKYTVIAKGAIPHTIIVKMANKSSFYFSAVLQSSLFLIKVSDSSVKAK